MKICPVCSGKIDRFSPRPYSKNDVVLRFCSVQCYLEAPKSNWQGSIESRVANAKGSNLHDHPSMRDMGHGK